MRHSLSVLPSEEGMDNLLSSLLVVTLPQLKSLMMMVCWFDYYIMCLLPAFHFHYQVTTTLLVA